MVRNFYLYGKWYVNAPHKVVVVGWHGISKMTISNEVRIHLDMVMSLCVRTYLSYRYNLNVRVLEIEYVPLESVAYIRCKELKEKKNSQ